MSELWSDSEDIDEKMTVVNIAVELFGDAHDDLFDTAIIVSRDGDLAPLQSDVAVHIPYLLAGSFSLAAYSPSPRFTAHEYVSFSC